MHTGAFEDLRTGALFSNTYNTRNPDRLSAPESGPPFAPPEADATIALATAAARGPGTRSRAVHPSPAFVPE